MKSTGNTYWPWIRSISPNAVLPGATPVSEDCHDPHVNSYQTWVSEGSYQRPVATERKHHIVPWPDPAAVQCCDYQAPAAAWKHHFWASSICSDTSAAKLLKAHSQRGRSQLAPPPKRKITTATFLICKINAWRSTSSAHHWKILHCYYVWRGFFFQVSYWHVTTTIFITLRWTFIKHGRKLTFFPIRGNGIWFFIPSKHLFTDRMNPINCFNPCIHLEPILYRIAKKHVIKVNEHNYQRVQIWGFWILFLRHFICDHFTICLHRKIRKSCTRLEDKRICIKIHAESLL